MTECMRLQYLESPLKLWRNLNHDLSWLLYLIYHLFLSIVSKLKQEFDITFFFCHIYSSDFLPTFYTRVSYVNNKDKMLSTSNNCENMFIKKISKYCNADSYLHKLLWKLHSNREIVNTGNVDFVLYNLRFVKTRKYNLITVLMRKKL